MDYTVRRVCPFCGEVIVLNRCSVYATDEPRTPVPAGRRHESLSALAEFDSTGEMPAEVPPPQRRPEPHPPRERRHDPLWSWRRPPAAEPMRRGRWFTPPPAAPAGEAPLMPLNAFPPERLARRFCSNPDCDQPLPPDLDERQAHIVAIVGLNGAGKTYFLATAFSEAMNGDGLDVAGFREFEPDDETARHFYSNYYTKVYRDNSFLESTPERARSEQRPLSFRARIDGGRPMLVMTHDIAGETLVDHTKRARDAGFLRRASGLIFLVDPVEFDAVRGGLPREELRFVRSIHQRDLLSATLRELEFEPGRQKVPAAVVISKADLLARFMPPGTRLLGPPRTPATDHDAWVREMQQSSTVVRDVLLHLGQQRLVRTAEEYGRVTFHAVSALGGRAERGDQIVPRPQRVLDPLAVVLWRLSAALR